MILNSTVEAKTNKSFFRLTIDSFELKDLQTVLTKIYTIVFLFKRKTKLKALNDGDKKYNKIFA